jgi:hypothetical protein
LLIQIKSSPSFHAKPWLADTITNSPTKSIMLRIFPAILGASGIFQDGGLGISMIQPRAYVKGFALA